MFSITRFSFFLAVTAAVSTASIPPVLAQKFLAFGRGVCNGAVTIPDTSVAVPPYQSRIFVPAVQPDGDANATRPIEWQCNGQPQTAINCPAGTMKVLIDRTQGARVVSIICLKR